MVSCIRVGRYEKYWRLSWQSFINILRTHRSVSLPRGEGRKRRFWQRDSVGEFFPPFLYRHLPWLILFPPLGGTPSTPCWIFKCQTGSEAWHILASRNIICNLLRRLLCLPLFFSVSLLYSLCRIFLTIHLYQELEVTHPHVKKREGGKGDRRNSRLDVAYAYLFIRSWLNDSITDTDPIQTRGLKYVP